MNFMSFLFGLDRREQDVIEVLRNLPVAIIIIRPDGEQEWYVWQCVESNGTAPTFAAAVNQALHALFLYV